MDGLGLGRRLFLVLSLPTGLGGCADAVGGHNSRLRLGSVPTYSSGPASSQAALGNAVYLGI